jgi:hypothetical protein
MIGTGFALMREERDTDDASNLWSLCNISAARSPMTTQGAMVLPVATRGMIDPSAAQAFDSMHLKLGVDNRHGIEPHFCRTRLVMISLGRISDEVFQFTSF